MSLREGPGRGDQQQGSHFAQLSAFCVHGIPWSPGAYPRPSVPKPTSIAHAQEPAHLPGRPVLLRWRKMSKV